MTTKSNAPTFPVALKTLLNDILRDNPTLTLTDKKMRARLRASKPVSREHNSPHVFTTQSQYDAVRSMFDAKYAARIAKPAKAKTPVVETPVVETPVVETPVSEDA